jgi:hypothetical protein
MTPVEFFNAMRIFGEPEIPEDGDLAAAIEAYVRTLGRFNEDVLKTAAEHILDTRKIRKFPLPAECREECERIEGEIAAKARKERKERKNEDPGSPERILLANKMLLSEGGQQAAEEGWVIPFHDFCRTQGRLPTRFEAADLKSRWQEWQRRNQSMVEKDGLPRVIRAIRKALEAKRTRLTAIALGASERVSE